MIQKTIMLEYLIRPMERDFFDLSPKEWSKVLRPISFQSKVVNGSGNLSLEIEGCEVCFYDEMVGIQVCFENCDIPEEKADLIIQEICKQLVSATGEKAKVVSLSV